MTDLGAQATSPRTTGACTERGDWGGDHLLAGTGPGASEIASPDTIEERPIEEEMRDAHDVIGWGDLL